MKSAHEEHRKGCEDRISHLELPSLREKKGGADQPPFTSSHQRQEVLNSWFSSTQWEPQVGERQTTSGAAKGDSKMLKPLLREINWN